MKTFALVGGLDVPVLPGLAAGEPARPGLVALRDVLASQLHHEHRAARSSLLDVPAAFTAESLFEVLDGLRADPPDRLWVVLASEIVSKRSGLYLLTSNANRMTPGLPLCDLFAELGEVGAGSLCVVLDVGRARRAGDLPPGLLPAGPTEVMAIAPAADLVVVGPRVLERLGAALLGTGAPGTQVKAAAVADAACSACSTVAARARDAALNLATGQKLASTEDQRQEVVIREVLGGVLTSTRDVLFKDGRCGATKTELKDVYVETAAHAGEAQPERPSDVRRRRGPAPEEADRQDRATLHEQVERHHHLFVVGDPGSGKTTFLRRLAHLAAQATLDGAAPVPGLRDRAVPVLARLEEFGRACLSDGRIERPPTASSLRAFVLGRLLADGGAPVGTDVGERLMRERRLVLLLDGLDEVPGVDLRRQMANAIATLASTCRDLRIIVTSRPAALRAGLTVGATFSTAVIEALDPTLQADFVGRWMATRLPPEEARAASSGLLAQLRANDRIADELRNPLLLTMVCVLFYRDGHLPTGRAELYDLMLQALLADRLEGDRFVWHGAAPDPGTRWRAAADVAWLHRMDMGDRPAEGVPIRESRVQEAIRRHLPDPLLAKDLQDFLELRGGLLDHAETRNGEALIVAPHRTFAEYLAASLLSTRPTEEAVALLVEKSADADWREITLLWVLIKTTDPRDPVEPARALVEALVARGAATPPNAACARLAAECVAECRGKETMREAVALVDDVLQPRLADPEGSREYPEAERVAFWLAIGTDDRRLVAERRWVDIRGGWAWRGQVEGDDQVHGDEKPGRAVRLSPFRIQRWPVCVFEYAAFVDPKTGGYADPSFWSPVGWEWLQREDERLHPEGWYGQRSRPNVPVVGVAWWEADAFCRWATVHLREAWDIDDGWDVRLPTEAEWEAAARARRSSPAESAAGACREAFPWGTELPDDTRAAFGERIRSAPPVGAYPAGASAELGLLDMAGGVWEWCLDAWSRGAYKADPPADPIVRVDDGLPVSRVDVANEPESAGRSAHRRVARGGSFVSGPGGLRATCRYFRDPWYRLSVLGFRCVLSPAGRPLVLGP